MPNLEIVRCVVTLETVPPIRQYGWMLRGVTTHYSLPFRSPEERERFARLLADQMGATVPDEEADALVALLCLSRSLDEAACGCATTHLEREFAHALSAEPPGELDDAVGRLLEEAVR